MWKIIQLFYFIFCWNLEVKFTWKIIRLHIRVARLFLIHHTKMGGNIYQMTAKLPNEYKIYQVTLKYSKWHLKNIYSMALQNTYIYPNWIFW
jgi:hypothetical protein